MKNITAQNSRRYKAPQQHRKSPIQVIYIAMEAGATATLSSPSAFEDSTDSRENQQQALYSSSSKNSSFQLIKSMPTAQKVSMKKQGDRHQLPACTAPGSASYQQLMLKQASK
ncbi:hypothetical protein Nepgr_015799 [Nepenthes gracilis]|uniref:Uncharacterized protein n=1 Tax=Nepenthes gracilis TaxID=150966 RepID=A0AAD3SMD5_NEPGR|nr:hypothetical protein Nepgr_015799 [Nepenthes gracilis]